MKKSSKIMGIFLLILLVSLGMGACSKEKPVEEEIETGSPEGVVLAYLQAFQEENYSMLEDMIHEMPKVGDIYFTANNQPPKTVLEMIRSQHEFITHFYGEDAWTKVTYDLLERDAGEIVVNLSFSEQPVHIMGYQNIHFLLSDESGVWQIKKGLSWEQDLYGGNSKPDYFRAEEANYRGINGTMTPDQVRGRLGDPIHMEEDEEYGYRALSMDYEDASYYFLGGYNDMGEFDRYHLESIVVMGGKEFLPRGIKIGDDFSDVMQKFPRDKDWTIDPYNCFYGENTLDGFGGACFTYEDDADNVYDTLVFVPLEYTPYYKLEFTNGKLMTAMLVYIQVQ
jgi:hypothetical protein